MADKLRQAGQLFGTSRRNSAEVFADYLNRSAADDADSSFLSAAALHGICAERLSTLYPAVRRLATEAEDDFVVETARWAEERIAGGTETPTR